MDYKYKLDDILAMLKDYLEDLIREVSDAEYVEGCKDGHEAGYDEGYADGYDIGYDEGRLSTGG